MRRSKDRPWLSVPAIAASNVWDDALPDAYFEANVDLVRPREDRRAELARTISTLGPFVRVVASGTSATPADATWRVRGVGAR